MGSRKIPLPSPLSRNPSSRLCAGQKLREAEAMGRGTNARKSTNRCRGETLSYPRSDLQPIHPLSSSLTECWHHMEPVGDSGLDRAPQARGGIGGVGWEAAGGEQFQPCLEALPALFQARLLHAKMEHSRLPPASWGRNRVKLSGKCTQLGYANGSSNNRGVMTPAPFREPPAGSTSQGWSKSCVPISQTRHLRLREGNAFAQVIQLLIGRARLQAQAPRSQHQPTRRLVWYLELT